MQRWVMGQSSKLSRRRVCQIMSQQKLELNTTLSVEHTTGRQIPCATGTNIVPYLHTHVPRHAGLPRALLRPSTSHRRSFAPLRGRHRAKRFLRAGQMFQNRLAGVESAAGRYLVDSRKTPPKPLATAPFRHVRINAAACAYCIHASDEALPSNSTQREATPQASGAKISHMSRCLLVVLSDVRRGWRTFPLPFPTPGSRRRAI